MGTILNLWDICVVIGMSLVFSIKHLITILTNGGF